MQRQRLTLVLGSFAVTCLLYAPAAAEKLPVLLVDEPPFTADLASVNADHLRFTDASLGTHNLDDLVRLGGFAEPRRGPLWLLADGGQLVAELIGMHGESLNGQSPILGDVVVPISAVRGVILQLPSDTRRRESLIATVTAHTVDADRIILHNGDQVRGTIESIGEESLAIVADFGKSNLALSGIAAIAFNPSLADRTALPSHYLIVGLTDGSRLVADSFACDGTEISFTTDGTLRAARASALSGLQVFGGRAVYLSDLKAVGYKHIPYLSLAWPLRQDRSVTDDPLRVLHQRHLKGLGMHTASRATYKLDGKYKQFQAELAIDDSAEENGSATCSVFVDDGSGKWQSRYTSPIIRGGEKPIPVRIDVRGIKAISLLTEYADRGDVQDHVDWLDARLVK